MLPLLTPTDFVALANQTLELAYPLVEIEGEVLNFKVSRGKWVYFDIADEISKLRCFGTVYMLPAPVEDGMKVRIQVSPRLHPQFGFSLNLKSLQFSGEGAIKKASDQLFEQLDKEGLFADERKRLLPYPPEHIGLITSAESAGYKDFIKILDARYGTIKIDLADVQVQGEASPGQVVRAIEWFNAQAVTPDVLVILRGGGSADDLQSFSTEQVTRAVAASRIPTLVAIGHEIDTSLAELAADQRASTPSNAAEILVPDKKDLLRQLVDKAASLDKAQASFAAKYEERILESRAMLTDAAEKSLKVRSDIIGQLSRTLEALSPQAILQRGYAIVRKDGKHIASTSDLAAADELSIQFHDGDVRAKVQ